MKKTGKRLLSALLAATLLAFAAGCQSGQSPSAGGDSGTSGGAEPTGNAGEKVEIQYWALPYGPSATYDPALQRIVDKYNAEDHGATVKLQVMSWSGFIEQIQTAIAAGSPPDVTTAAYYGLMNYAAMGEALDLGSIVEKWEAENDPILDDFLDGMVENGVYDGTQIALPFQTDGKTIYYRADILEDELGFTDLDKEVTWDKLLEICAAVKERYGDEGMFPLSFFSLDQGSTNAMLDIMFSNGTSWVSEDGTHATLTDPKVLECMEFLKTIQDNGYFPDGMVSYNMPDVEKLYDSGKVAMVWKSPFSHTLSNPEMYENTKLMGPIVGPSADKAREVAWSDGIMGFAQTQHPEETKEFIEWLLKNYESLFIEGGASALPVRKSFYENEFYQTDWMLSQYAAHKDYFVDLSWPASSCPLATNQVFIQNMLGRPVEAMLMGSEDLQAELEKTNAEIDKVFAELN